MLRGGSSTRPVKQQETTERPNSAEESHVLTRTKKSPATRKQIDKRRRRNTVLSDDPPTHKSVSPSTSRPPVQTLQHQSNQTNLTYHNPTLGHAGDMSSDPITVPPLPIRSVHGHINHEHDDLTNLWSLESTQALAIDGTGQDQYFAPDSYGDLETIHDTASSDWQALGRPLSLTLENSLPTPNDAGTEVMSWRSDQSGSADQDDSADASTDDEALGHLTLHPSISPFELHLLSHC